MTQQINVYGDLIEECCSNPITGFYRDGFCRTDQMDRGLHVVCAKVTDEFLDFQRAGEMIYLLLGLNLTFQV